MLVHCWLNVADVVPTVNQNGLKILCYGMWLPDKRDTRHVGQFLHITPGH